MTTSTQYRMIGTTDDVVDCARCGKADLRATVILAILDEDGNEADRTYYGSSCAAKALAERGIRRTGRQVLDEARIAQRRAVAAATEAREMLEFLGLDVDPGTDTVGRVVEAIRRYVGANPGAAGDVDRIVARVADLRATAVAA